MPWRPRVRRRQCSTAKRQSGARGALQRAPVINCRRGAGPSAAGRALAGARAARAGARAAAGARRSKTSCRPRCWRPGRNAAPEAGEQGRGVNSRAAARRPAGGGAATQSRAPPRPAPATVAFKTGRPGGNSSSFGDPFGAARRRCPSAPRNGVSGAAELALVNRNHCSWHAAAAAGAPGSGAGARRRRWSTPPPLRAGRVRAARTLGSPGICRVAGRFWSREPRARHLAWGQVAWWEQGMGRDGGQTRGENRNVGVGWKAPPAAEPPGQRGGPMHACTARTRPVGPRARAWKMRATKLRSRSGAAYSLVSSGACAHESGAARVPARAGARGSSGAVAHGRGGGGRARRRGAAGRHTATVGLEVTVIGAVRCWIRRAPVPEPKGACVRRRAGVFSPAAGAMVRRRRTQSLKKPFCCGGAGQPGQHAAWAWPRHAAEARAPRHCQGYRAPSSSRMAAFIAPMLRPPSRVCARTTLLKGCITPVHERGWVPSMSRTRLPAAAAAAPPPAGGGHGGPSARRLPAALVAARRLAGRGSAGGRVCGWKRRRGWRGDGGSTAANNARCVRHQSSAHGRPPTGEARHARARWAPWAVAEPRESVTSTCGGRRQPCAARAPSVTAARTARTVALRRRHHAVKGGPRVARAWRSRGRGPANGGRQWLRGPARRTR